MGVTGGKYLIKCILTLYEQFIIGYTYADELLYLDKLFQNHSFRILFPMILIT